MTTNDVTPSTRYFWLATFQWPSATGFTTASLYNTVEIAGQATRTGALAYIKTVAAERGVPDNATLLFLSIEPDQLNAPAA